MKRILVDQENSAERFWDEVNDRAGKGDRIAQRLAEADLTCPLLLSDPEADALLAYARQVPGWADGPEYAREALLVQDAQGYQALAVRLVPGAEWTWDCLGTYRLHGDGEERLLLEAGEDVEARLDEDGRVEKYRTVVIYDWEIPGSHQVDCPNGVVAYVVD